MKPFNHNAVALKESIFTTITQAAIKNSAINLAQGFPDFDGPEWVLKIAQQSLLEGKNQYAPALGAPSLLQAISANYKKYYNLDYAAQGEIIVTNGATEAIYCTIAALVNANDEVVTFEPMYDSYLAAIQLAGGVNKVVTLKEPNFSFDPEELKSVITDKTKLLILNNPNNPTGKVFNHEELEFIADLAIEHDFYILSDEVYEFLTFEKKHIPVATLKKVKNRVITISSIGKTLSLTGWKIGWACASADIIKAINNVHQFVSFCVSHPIQIAVAEILTKLDDYLPEFKKSYQEKRKILTEGLKNLGYEVYNPEGTYFSLVKVPEGFMDMEYCQKLILEKKVAAIPTSGFYVKSLEGQKLIRFCFAKKNETLLIALKHLGSKDHVIN